MISQRLYIDREKGTATIIETSKTNSIVKKLGELTWVCESEEDYDKVKFHYPRAKIIETK